MRNGPFFKVKIDLKGITKQERIMELFNRFSKLYPTFALIVVTRSNSKVLKALFVHYATCVYGVPSAHTCPSLKVQGEHDYFIESRIKNHFKNPSTN